MGSREVWATPGSHFPDVSIFGGSVSNDEVHQNLMKHNGEIRYEMGKRLGKSFRRIPELAFHIDDSLDYAEEIDRLLKE